MRRFDVRFGGASMNRVTDRVTNRVAAAALCGLAVAVPAVAASIYFSIPAVTAPCFAAPTGAFRIADKAADFTVRIDNAAANPSLSLQVVDDPAGADFVLVDDGAPACASDTPLKSVRLDPSALAPDLTVALSRAPAAKKIYVNSARFSQEEAAALFAASWGARAVTAHAVPR